MFNSIVIDVAIGLILFYFLLSLACSALRESIAGIFKTRAKMLERGIEELLRSAQAQTGAPPAGPPPIVRDFYEHPLISVLFEGNYVRGGEKRFSSLRPSNLPSYIPKQAFSLALLDLAARGPVTAAAPAIAAGPETAPLTADAVRRGIGRLGSLGAQRVILTALDTARGDLDGARKNIESWYDDAMGRVSGWYKRRTQLVLFLIGLVATVLFDFDSVRVAQKLYADPASRSLAVASAGAVLRDSVLATAARQQRADSTTAGAANARTLAVAQDAIARLGNLELPIAWQDITPSSGGWTVKNVTDHAKSALLGWLLTAFAISFGAAFWFDMLSKIMVVRSTMKPQESPDTSRDQVKTATATSTARTGGANGAAPTMTPVAAAPISNFTPHEWAAGNPQGGVV